MELAVSIFLILLGTAFAFLCVWHENMWRQRKNWKISTGKVIDYEKKHTTDGTSTYPPIIEYQTSNGSSKFVSKYSSNRKPKVGTDRSIIISEDELNVEQYTFASRWLFTIAPIPFAFIFISLGINMLKNCLG